METSHVSEGVALLQIQHQLVLFREGEEAAGFVVFEDGVHHRLGFVDDLDQIQVLPVDHAFADQAVADPVEQALPERPMDQDDRNPAALSGLDEGHGLQEFIEGAEPPWHDHIG